MATHTNRGAPTRIVPKLLLVVALIASSLFTTAAAQAEETSERDLSSVLPDGASGRYAQLHQSLGISGPLDSLIGSAINPGDFECGDTEFDVWADALFAGVDPDLLDLLFSFFVPFWAGDSTVLFDDDPSDTYVGTNGEYTREQKKRHRKADRFWDAPTSDVQLHGITTTRSSPSMRLHSRQAGKRSSPARASSLTRSSWVTGFSTAWKPSGWQRTHRTGSTLTSLLTMSNSRSAHSTPTSPTRPRQHVEPS